VEPERRAAWLALAGLLLSSSVATALVLSGRPASAWWYLVAGVGALLGLVISDALLGSPVLGPPVRTWRRFVRQRATWTETFRCPNGHSFPYTMVEDDPSDIVRGRPGTARVVCPECGAEVEHRATMEPRNWAARRAARYSKS
jgi:uncharacterized protein (DUF58 family)